MYLEREICLDMAKQLGIETPYDVYAEQCNSSATALTFQQLKFSFLFDRLINKSEK